MANPMTSLALLFVVSIIFLPILPSFHNVEATGQREFDYFLLTLLWPGTICAATHHCCSSNACCRSSALTEFTIHGLWVDYNDGTWPACCSHSDFDIKKIKSLLPTLEKYWPSLYCSSSSLCFGGKGLFWAHEVAISGTSCCFMLIFLCITNLLYFSCMCLMVFGSVQWEKHGTCAYPVIKDEYSYFSKALDLYFKYNMTEVLNVAGILATNSEKYPLHDVVTIIQTAFGATPSLVCKHDSVEELRLCFDKDFKPRDCTKSSCPKYIRLPTYAPLGLEDVSGAYPHDSF